METKPTVLIIDDEKDLTDMISFQFRSKGYNTVTASDGIEGLEKLATIKPDLIILDLNMPRMGGIEFYQHICESGGKPSCPVLVLTARANTEQLFKDLDIDGFMAKPFEIADLIKEGEVIIEKHRRTVTVTRTTRKTVLHSVYVAEDDTEQAKAITIALLQAGYRVALARSGSTALELLALDPPALGLIKLALPDISGDVVAHRALDAAKTSGVKFLLYEKRDQRHLRNVRQIIGDKTGIIDLVEYESPTEILRAVDAAIQKGVVEAGDDTSGN